MFNGAMNKAARTLVNVTVTLIGLSIFVGSLMLGTARTTGAAEGYAGHGMRVNPEATLDTSSFIDTRVTTSSTTDTADTADEGADLVGVQCDLGGAEGSSVLCEGLLAQGWRGVQGDHCDCVYGLTGTAVYVGGSMLLVTVDGIAVCEPGWTAHQCTPTGPVELTDYPVITPGAAALKNLGHLA